jgi:ribosomal protein L37AE/L43A
VFCNYCGARNPEDALYCSKCGRSITGAVAPPQTWGEAPSPTSEIATGTAEIPAAKPSEHPERLKTTPVETPKMVEGHECPKCGSKATEIVEELADSDRWLCHTCGKKWRQPTQDAHHLVGVGGWLVLFILSLIVFSPILTTIKLIKEFEELGLVLATVLDAAISIALMSFGIYAGVRLWKVKPNAVRIAKRYLIAVFIYSGVLLLLIVLGSIYTPTDEKTSSQEIGTVGRSLLYVIIWYSYLEKSKRVAATYATPNTQ